MADTYAEDDTEEESSGYTVDQAIGQQNITHLFSEQELGEIATRCIKDFELDDEDFGPRRERITELYKLALQTIEQKSYPWAGASNIKYPILTKAAISFASLAFPAIVKDDKVVKGKVIGSDEGGEELTDSSGNPMLDDKGKPIRKNAGVKQIKADRVADFMSNQLINDMDSWEDETDKLLHIIPIVGCAFRKVYRDDVERTNASRLVLPQYLIANINATTVENAARISELVNLYPSEIEENIRAGIFAEFDYGISDETREESYEDSDSETTSQVDEDSPHVFIEQHRRLDLDGDGYPEPYIVWLHKESKSLVRMLPRFEAEDIKRDVDGSIIKIKPQVYYIKYGFIPDPEGSFYDIGFGHLLQHLNVSVNATINQMIDQGHRYTMGGGFIAKGPKIKGGELRFRPGEWKRAEVTGVALRDSIVPLPMPEPSTVLMALMEALINSAEDISMLTKAMAGEIPPNIPATSMLALIEQSMQPFKAVFKRVHRSLKREFKRLFYLNKMYLDEQEYKEFCDEDTATMDDWKVSDVLPVSDPDIINNMQALIRAQALMELKDDPLIDGIEVRKIALKAMNIRDGADLVKIPPQQTDELLEAQVMLLQKQMAQIDQKMHTDIINAQIAIDKSIYEVKKLHSEAIKNVAQAEGEEQGQNLAMYEAFLNEMDQLKERLGNGNNGRGVPEMEAAPGNASIPQIPQ